MSVTHQDVIDYIYQYYPVNGNNYYEVLQGKLHIKEWILFDQFKHDALPSSMVFDYSCDLVGFNIKVLPPDIVLNSDLYIFDKSVITPVLNVPGRIYIKDNDTIIQDCTYIGYYIRSANSNYDYLDLIRIGGYFFETGLLS